jgi:hypothetical protein
VTFLYRMLSLLRGEVPGKLRYVPAEEVERAQARATAPQRRLAARRQVVDHLLRTVAASSWREHLVLRGSVLVREWLGDAAREPGDVDWAVVPETLSAREPPGELLVDGLLEVGPPCRRSGEPLIRWDRVGVQRIWVYSASPGLRATFPWQHQDLSGAEQMDFSFGDTFLIPAVEADVPTGDGGTVRLLTATVEQSLLWKLKWLDADDEPRAKDLYDATLLAEALAARKTPVPAELVRRALSDPPPGAPSPRGGGLFSDIDAEVDWSRFRREHPGIVGSAREWQERLVRALSASFADAGGGSGATIPPASRVQPAGPESAQETGDR